MGFSCYMYTSGNVLGTSTLGPGNITASGLSQLQKALGQHWVGHFSPLRERDQKKVFQPCRTSILAVRLFSRSVGALARSHDYCKFVRQWVWFESAQAGCNGTCVKLEASNPPEVERWYFQGIHRLKVTSTEKYSAVNQLTFSCSYVQVADVKITSYTIICKWHSAIFI